MQKICIQDTKVSLQVIARKSKEKEMSQPMLNIQVNYQTNKEEFEKEVQEIITLVDQLKKKLNELDIKLTIEEKQKGK
jgi:hypothetical protein